MKNFEYLLLALPLIVHLFVDYSGVVKHKLNAAYVLGIAVLVGFVLPGFFWQGAFYALCIHFTFFDPIYNLMHGHNLFYYGDPDNPDRAWMDKMREAYVPPHAEVFIRLWMLGVGIGVYHYLPNIIGYIP